MVSDSASAAKPYTLEDPVSVKLKPQSYLYVETHGPFSTSAPQAWMKLHGEVIPSLTDKSIVSTDMFGLSQVRFDAEGKPSEYTYRAGALLTGPCDKVPSIDGVKVAIGEHCDKARYAKFKMTGGFASVGPAFQDALAAVRAHDSMRLRNGSFCMEQYITDPSTTPENENVVMLYVPVNEWGSDDNTFTLTGPEVQKVAPLPMIYLEGTGVMTEIAGPLWMKMFGEVIPAVGTDKIDGRWGMSKLGDVNTYRASCTLKEKLATVPAGAHTAEAHCDDGKYAVFKLTGFFDILSVAWPKALQAIKDHDTLRVRSGSFCMEQYITDPMTTAADDNVTLLYVPVNEWGSDDNKFTLTGPEIQQVAPRPSMYVEAKGDFAETAGPLWGKMHGTIIPEIDKSNIDGMWGIFQKCDDNANSIYRATCTLKEKLATAPQGALTNDAHCVAGKYAVFKLTGWFDALGLAWPKAMQAIKDHDTLRQRPNVFCMEQYMTDMATTPADENVTLLYIPVYEWCTGDSPFTIEGPTLTTLTPQPHLYTECSGEYLKCATTAWPDYLSAVLPQLNTADTTGVWAVYGCESAPSEQTGDFAVSPYRSGMTFAAKPASTPTIEGVTLKWGEHCDELTYAKFKVTGWFDSVGRAVAKAARTISDDDALAVREDAMWLENCIFDMEEKPMDEHVTYAYIPVRRITSPTKTHRTEGKK